MLTIVVKGDELFDNEKQEFIDTELATLELEHSLVSLARWESKWEKPFLGKDPKTTEETLGYIESMTMTPGISPEIYHRLSDDNIVAINEYIEGKMTATWFREIPGQASRSQEVVTAEIIYYWMIALNIPMEAQNWHLNKLITLIRVLNQKNAPPKKMGKAEAQAQQRSLNEQRRAQQQSAG